MMLFVSPLQAGQSIVDSPEKTAVVKKIENEKLSGLAVAGMILGIIGIASWTWIGLTCAVVGLVLSTVAMRKIRKSGGKLRGRGMAITGIIASLVGFVVLIVGVALQF